MNLPHIQFYVGDWRRDIAVQSLSYHHRGIWLELLMLMHCSEQRGRLVLNGKPMSNLNLARLLGLSEQETTDAVKNLLEGGVASIDQNGALINRRMVREEELRQKRRQAASIGGSKTAAKREQTPDNDNDNGLEKVREFGKEKGIPEKDCDWFYFKGKGNGWTNGGNPILDWKATLLSWKRAEYLPSQKVNNGNGSKPWQQKQTDPNQERRDREYEQHMEQRKRKHEQSSASL